ASFRTKELPEEALPGRWVSLFTALLPVLLLAFASFLPLTLPPGSALGPVISFIGNPSIVMLTVLTIATYLLGIRRGQKMNDIMALYTEAVKDVAMILLIITGSGA